MGRHESPFWPGERLGEARTPAPEGSSFWFTVGHQCLRPVWHPADAQQTFGKRMNEAQKSWAAAKF